MRGRKRKKEAKVFASFFFYFNFPSTVDPFCPFLFWLLLLNHSINTMSHASQVKSETDRRMSEGKLAGSPASPSSCS